MRILAYPGPGMRSINPYSYLFYTNIDAEVIEYSRKTLFDGRYDIFHIHWPESALNTLGARSAYLHLQKKLCIIDVLRSRGTKIVWTVHNLKSHEQLHPRLEAWFWKAFTKRLDAFFALSQAGEKAVRARFSAMETLPGYVIPHGHYRGEYANEQDLKAREKLGISPNAIVVLSFGEIRPYKNIDQLISAFRQLPDENLVLMIVGSCQISAYAKLLSKLASDDSRIRFTPERIPSEDVQLYMQAADLVALPYRDILNSGTALLALSFNRPILVPEFGAMKELASSVGTDWVMNFPGDLSSKVLRDAINWAMETERTDIAPLNEFEWGCIGSKATDAFRRICSQ